jgi:transcriptional regulator with XRE-family HTH domain
VSKNPDPIDINVGARVRMLRQIKDVSQTQLGERLGITFQQVQKYEKGTNRISASRLMAICEFLDVPPSYFFDEAPTVSRPDTPLEINDVGAFIASKEGLSLNKAFLKIKDPKIRKLIVSLVKATANMATDDDEPEADDGKAGSRILNS